MTKSEAIIEKAVAGAMGKEVIIRTIRGKIVVTDKPVFKERVLSKKQELVTDLMEEANGYAQAQMSDEQLRNAAQIRLNVTRQRLYTALVSEYWKTHWESLKKKQEAEDLAELERLKSQRKAGPGPVSNLNLKKQEELSEKKENKSDFV